MKFALLAVALVIISPAMAGTTENLYKVCNAPAGTADASICAAYINGLAEGVLADQIAREGGISIFFPDRITTPQVRDAIKAFVDSKAFTILQLPTGGVVAAALQATYPCPKSN